MANIGISIRIDVSKIDKSRLYKGAKGTYLDLTTFVDTDKPDQYDNHGFISQSVSKEERKQQVRTPILGNCKVFYGAGNQQGQGVPQPQPSSPQAGPDYGQPQSGDYMQGGEMSDEIPFNCHMKNTVI